MIFKKQFSQFNSLKNTENDIDKDRLFFHDLINLTHGISLFLTQKQVSKNGINNTELEIVLKEIKTLQSLVTDHYNFDHKNLVDTYKWVTSNMLQYHLEHLINVYLNNRVEFVFKKNSTNSLFYFPTFYRVTNNIIKNMYDSKVENISIVLEINENSLELRTMNDMPSQKKSLELIILDESVRKKECVGLDSISHLVEENVGVFDFEIRDNKWINKLVLPSQEFDSKSAKKAA